MNFWGKNQRSRRLLDVHNLKELGPWVEADSSWFMKLKKSARHIKCASSDLEQDRWLMFHKSRFLERERSDL
jgi:hypothetical protein